MTRQTKTFILTIFYMILTMINAPAHAEDQALHAKIGLASNFSYISPHSANPYENYFFNAVQLALEDVKNRLDENGMNVEVKKYDFGSNPLQIMENIKQAKNEGVTAMIGYIRSQEALLAAAEHQKNRIPMLTPTATANRLKKFDSFVHRLSGDNDYISKVMAYLARNRLKAEKAVVISISDCAYCQDLAESFENKFKKDGGFVVKKINLLNNRIESNDAIKSLLNLDYDVIVVPNHELESAKIIALILDLGISKPFLGGEGWGFSGSRMFGIVAKPFTSLSLALWHPDMNHAQSKDFVNKFKERYGFLPDSMATLSYDATNIILEGIIKQKSAKAEKIERYLSSLQTYEGAGGTYYFGKNRTVKRNMVVLFNRGRSFEVSGIFNPDQL